MENKIPDTTRDSSDNRLLIAGTHAATEGPASAVTALLSNSWSVTAVDFTNSEPDVATIGGRVEHVTASGLVPQRGWLSPLETLSPTQFTQAVMSLSTTGDAYWNSVEFRAVAQAATFVKETNHTPHTLLQEFVDTLELATTAPTEKPDDPFRRRRARVRDHALLTKDAPKNSVSELLHPDKETQVGLVRLHSALAAVTAVPASESVFQSNPSRSAWAAPGSELASMTWVSVDALTNPQLAGLAAACVVQQVAALSDSAPAPQAVLLVGPHRLAPSALAHITKLSRAGSGTLAITVGDPHDWTTDEVPALPFHCDTESAVLNLLVEAAAAAALSD